MWELASPPDDLRFFSVITFSLGCLVDTVIPGAHAASKGSVGGQRGARLAPPGHVITCVPNTMRHERASHRVGTQLLFENDHVRVWEMRLRPGETSDRHVHENDYLFVCLNDAQVTLYPEHGSPEVSRARAGGVVYTEVGKGIIHRLENSGNTDHREILVELKGPSRSEEPQEPQTNEPA